jgi:hypothetical protein
LEHAWLLQDMQRPLYMRPLDAIEYGVIDRLVPPQKASMMIDQVPPRLVANNHCISACYIAFSGLRWCPTMLLA